MGCKLGREPHLLFEEGEWGTNLTQSRLGRGLPPYEVASWAIWPQQIWLKIGEGLCPFGGGRAGSPSNIMWPGPRPTCIPSFILVRPTVWPQCTNITDRQQSDSIRRTVLQTVAQKLTSKFLDVIQIQTRNWNCAARGSLNIQDAKMTHISPSGHHRTTLSGYVFATKACIDNRKKTC